MTQKLRQTSKAMTAIAAVLAFSTPLLAQETAAPDPVTESDPLAPDAADAAPVVTDTADAPPAPPQPKVETTRSATATTTKRTASSATRSTARRASTAAPAAATPAPAAAIAPAAQPEETAPPIAAPLPAEPLPTTVAEAGPGSDSVEAPITDLWTDEALPIAGAAALGLLALGGAGLAMRRSRRRREEAEFQARQQFLDRAEAEHEDEAHPLELDRRAEIRPGPAFMRPAPIHDPVPARKTPAAAPIADAPTTDLPAGFDLSRFGPHVQAAYRGPTEDNPSLSLKHRVRRAAAMDQQERRDAEDLASNASDPIPAKGNWESRADAEFLFRRADRQVKEPADQQS